MAALKYYKINLFYSFSRNRNYSVFTYIFYQWHFLKQNSTVRFSEFILILEDYLKNNKLRSKRTKSKP